MDIKLAPFETCSGCSSCKAICPKDAITMCANEDGFLYPKINETSCAKCHLCEKTCPVLHPGEADLTPTVYAAYTIDTPLRLKSTSGGIFTELARPIINAGGVVFGCVWEKPHLTAIHVKAETIEHITAMRGSKYVQSDVRNTYREVKAALLQDQRVLYSGTPCQIAGLNAFLGKTYDNLLLVEIICHGAPAPNVFKKYKEMIEGKFQRNITDISFRDKLTSWRKSQLTITFDTSKISLGQSYANDYGRAFIARLITRESCASCSARQGRSGADITLGDFWGIENVCPQLDDDRGISIVLCHTRKGRDVWKELQGQMISKEVPYPLSVQANSNYLCSPPRATKRDYFMTRYNKQAFPKLLRSALDGPPIYRISRRLVGKLLRILHLRK